MPVAYKEHLIEPVVELHVTGKVTEADMARIIPQLEEFILRHGKIRVLEVVEDFTGFGSDTIWSGMKFNAEHFAQITHVAVVSDIGWLSPIVKAASALTPTELRSFVPGEADAARAWLSHPDAV